MQRLFHLRSALRPTLIMGVISVVARGELAPLNVPANNTLLSHALHLLDMWVAMQHSAESPAPPPSSSEVCIHVFYDYYKKYYCIHFDLLHMRMDCM